MGDSKIEWTEKTWNPVTGCSKVSQGCKNCYALRLFPKVYPGRDFGDVRTHEDRLDAPLHWRKPSRIFVNSMSDLFHEKVPTDFIYRVFMVMWSARQHTFQVLTKRPERMKELVAAWLDVDRMLMQKFAPDALPGGGGIPRTSEPLSNVWLGVSVEDQKTADERIPILLQTPAAVRWISYEPALGPVDFNHWLRISWQCSGCREYFSGGLRRICPKCGREDYWSGSHEFNPPGGQVGSGLDWIVCGGESGPGARPMHPDWARSARDQCQAAGVPFFFKQWGEWKPVSDNPFQPREFLWLNVDGRNSKNDALVVTGQGWQCMARVGKHAAGRLLDTREWNEYPQVPERLAVPA